MSATTFGTFAEYEQWLADKWGGVQLYFEAHETPMEELPLSPRIYNALRIQGVRKLSQLIVMQPEDMQVLPFLGKTEVAELLAYRRACLKEHMGSIVAFLSPKTEAHGSLKDPETEIVLPPIKVSVFSDAEEVEKEEPVENPLEDPKLRAEIAAMFKARDIPVTSMGLSNRSVNALSRQGVMTAYDAIAYYPDRFYLIRNLGEKSIREICGVLEDLARKGGTPHEAVECFPRKNPLPDKVTELIKDLDICLEELGLSRRSYNALEKVGIRKAHEIVKYYPYGFNDIRNLGEKSIDEICTVLETLVKRVSREEEHVLESLAAATTHEEYTVPEIPLQNCSLAQILVHPVYGEKAKRYIKAEDIPIENMHLDTRTLNILKEGGKLTFSQILEIYPYRLHTLKRMGDRAREMIQERMEFYCEKFKPYVIAYCEDDFDSLYTDEYITEKLLACYANVGFAGLSFAQMSSALPEGVSPQRIKNCIGKLIAAGKLEYVDFRCYRVYPSILKVLEESDISPEWKETLRLRFEGLKLKAIGERKGGKSREWIRQEEIKGYRALNEFAKRTYGTELYDEDFYTYLYMNYALDKEAWIKYLGMPEKMYGYLANAYDRGEGSLENALGDPKVNVILKMKLREYLNRDMILIDGILIKHQRGALEEYAVSQLCRSKIKLSAFIEKYNAFLRKKGVPYSEEIYYDENDTHTIKNRLARSKSLLWSQGEYLRYYPIAQRDYTDLLEQLNLEGLMNTEVSTLKMFNQNRSLMESYDIRDQYELHYLLRQVVDTKLLQFSHVTFEPQPMIQFGEFDRDQAIYEVIEAFSPITAEELAEYLSSEYGYNKNTAIAGYFKPFMQYYHRGVFSVDFKSIPTERVMKLNDALLQEFYYISEIKKCYTSLFPGADEDEINHRSLKALGFVVLGKYVIRNYSSAEAFFKAMLLRDDVFSVRAMIKRYGSIYTFRQTLLEVRRDLDILQFDTDQYINFRKLEKMGITKDDLRDYCERVYDIAENEDYFTYRSLPKIESKLDDLGFDEKFYTSLLMVSGKFAYTHIFGTDTFYKGESLRVISTGSFYRKTLAKYKAVEPDDYIYDIREQYGIDIREKYDVLAALANTEFYYDSIMGKIYGNKNYYYGEFDE